MRRATRQPIRPGLVRERIDGRAMAALSSGHCAVDFAAARCYVMIPYLHDEFDLSYTLAAVLVLCALLSLVGSSSRCSACGRTGTGRSG